MGEGQTNAGTVPVENVRDETLKDEAERVLRVEKSRRAANRPPHLNPARACLPACRPAAASRLPPWRCC